MPCRKCLEDLDSVLKRHEVIYFLVALVMACTSSTDIIWSVSGILPVCGTSFSSAFWNNQWIYCGGIWWNEDTNENDLCWTQDRQFSLPEKRGYSQSWQRGNKLYILGGRKDYRAQVNFWELDLDILQFHELASMLHPRLSFALGVFENGDVIVAGGTEPNETGFENVTTLLDSADYYNSSLNEWREIEPIPSKMEGVGVVWKDRFLFLGGVDFPTQQTVPRNYHHEILEYRNGWIPVGEMPEDRSGFCAIPYEDELFVIGGHSLETRFKDRVLAWDQSTWRELPSKLVKAVSCESPVIDGTNIYLLGGEISDPQRHNKTDLIQHGEIK